MRLTPRFRGAGIRAAGAVSMAWEYQDLSIPLNLTWTITSHGPLTDRSEERRGREEIRARYSEVVRAHLDRVAQDGWEPAEPVDFDAVVAGGRLQVTTAIQKESTTFAFGEVRAVTSTHTYEAVGVRLRREVRGVT
jgi:hypothetical protein